MMENIFTPFNASLELADMAWEVKCREEDIRHRMVENERRKIDDARRAVDEKAKQLEAISNLSALFAGFAMIVMVEITIPSDLNLILSITFGMATAGVIALMLLATLNATLMLVAIMKYDCIKREIPFTDFWVKRCESDWQLSYKAFSTGIPLFLCVLGQIGWIQFSQIKHGELPASVISIIAIVTIGFWYIYTDRKWSAFLQSSGTKLVNINFTDDDDLYHDVNANANVVVDQNIDDEDNSESRHGHEHHVHHDLNNNNHNHK